MVGHSRMNSLEIRSIAYTYNIATINGKVVSAQTNCYTSDNFTV